MHFTHLGRTGLEVSRLCLGTMNFGPETEEDTAHAIMDRAHEVGINFFDTANVYGWSKGAGVTEQIIGRWLSHGGGRRERTVLATKVFGVMGDWPNQRRLSALHIRQACEDSLRRLQTDHIDLYQMHHVDRETPWDEIWEAMDILVHQGKVLYVGSSNFAGWHIATAQATARERRSLGLVSEQSVYSLMKRTVELEVIPACQSLGLAVLPWSPLAGGLLAGILRKEREHGGHAGRARRERTQSLLAAHRPTIEAYEALCADIGVDPAAVGLAWVLRQPGVTSPVVGPRTLAQLDAAVDAVDLTLDRDTLGRLDDLFPGPGGPAPEAYSW